MSDNNKKIIAVVGPTASGKSELALRLCESLDGELVSFDSMQIYRHLDIGTAKPTEEEQRRAVHHMIDICEPDENYSVADFSVRAKSEIDGVLEKGRVPVICGGTGLYIDSVLSGTDFGEITSDEEYRAFLFAKAEKEGNGALHKMLRDIDPEAAGQIHENNVKRVVRALEIFKATGMTKTEWDKKAAAHPSPYNAVIIGLDYRSRDTLYGRIDTRVDKMFSLGLENEVRALLLSGFLGEDTTAGQAIGYKETAAYIKGDISLAEAVQTVKQSTRRYAKRQLTWFRRNKSISWLFPDDYKDADALTRSALSVISKEEE